MTGVCSVHRSVSNLRSPSHNTSIHWSHVFSGATPLPGSMSFPGDRGTTPPPSVGTGWRGVSQLQMGAEVPRPGYRPQPGLNGSYPQVTEQQSGIPLDFTQGDFGFFTDRVRSMRGGYIFSLCVSPHLGGYPIRLMGGVPHPRSSWGGYPIPGPAGGYPIPGPAGGSTPSSRWGGTPSCQKGGARLGYPPGRGTPPPAGVPPRLGYPPSPHRLGAAVGMPSCVHAGGLSCFKNDNLSNFLGATETPVLDLWYGLPWFHRLHEMHSSQRPAILTYVIANISASDKACHSTMLSKPVHTERLT